MKSTDIRSLALSAAMAAATYFGFIEGIEGVRNIMTFFVWAICLPLMLLSATNYALEKLAKDWQPMPRMLVYPIRAVSIGCVVAMIWTGHVATAAALAACVLIRIVVEKVVGDMAAARATREAAEGAGF